MASVSITIANKPHAAQQEVLDSAARFRVLMCGRRFGKSLISQIISLLECSKGHKIAYITPTYLLAKAFFSELDKVLPSSVKRNASDLKIEMNGGVVRFFTGERLDNLRGLKFHLVLIDEASFIPDLEDGWINSIRPTLTDYRGKAIFLSTPRGKNYFYSLFLKGQGGDINWQSFKFSTYDNPFIDKEEIDSARLQMPDVAFRQEYLADPSENAANPFGNVHIQSCVHPLSNSAPVCFGIDLAKSSDYTVIIGLDQHGNTCWFDRFQRDWRSTTQAITALPKVPMLIDATGVGDPIVEDLQREGIPVTGFKFTSSSKQQIMEGLISSMHQRKISYPPGIIVAEMETFEYQYTKHGVRYSAPSGFHDDTVCALALANHHRTINTGTGRYAFA
jgi:phage FluMu gp28-like protein